MSTMVMSQHPEDLGGVVHLLQHSLPPTSPGTGDVSPKESRWPAYYTNPPEPLFPEGTAVQIKGQAHRSDLNERYAAVVGRDGLRMLVITATSDFLSIADNQLVKVELVPGTRVTVVGLKSATQHNGQIGVVTQFVDGRWTIHVQEAGRLTAISVRPSNLVVTPMQADHPGQHHFNNQYGMKRKRDMPFTGRTGLPQGRSPVSNLSADISLVITSAEPILRRCGSLRKIIFSAPGFACKCVCVLALMHKDARYVSKGFIPADAPEGVRLAEALGLGNQDGMLRKYTVHSSEINPLTERCAVVSDRHCTAAHLIYAIDENVGGIKDALRSLMQQQFPTQMPQFAQQQQPITGQ